MKKPLEAYILVRMIRGIGVDMVAVARLEGAMRRWGERFMRRVFTPRERAQVMSSPFPVEGLAARFAAKEAFLKALGKGLFEIPFIDIEVVREQRGRPFFVLHGRAREVVPSGIRIHLSLSHDAGMAIAFVVLEGGDEACDRRGNERA